MRLSTNKEAPDRFISSDIYATIIYNYWVFDVPTMFDLCAIAADRVGLLLSKMITNIFLKQPAYRDDLRQSLVGISTLIHRTCLQFEQEGLPSDIPTHNPTPELVKTQNIRKIALHQLSDLCSYINDLACTLCKFFQTFPECAGEIHDTSLIAAVCCLYSSVLLPILDQLAVNDSKCGLSLDQISFPDKSSELGDRVVMQAFAIASERALLDCISAIIRNVFIPSIANQLTQSGRIKAHGNNSDDLSATSRPIQKNHQGVNAEEMLIAAFDSLIRYQAVATCIRIEAVLDDAFITLSNLEDRIDIDRLLYYKKILVSSQTSDNVTSAAERSHNSHHDNHHAGRAKSVSQSVEVFTDHESNRGDSSVTVFDQKIDQVQMILPHLGRGFIFACLTKGKVCLFFDTLFMLSWTLYSHKC